MRINIKIDKQIRYLIIRFWAVRCVFCLYGKAKAVAKMKAEGVSGPRNQEEQGFCWVGRTFLKNSSKNIPRNSGAVNVKNYLYLYSN